MCGLVREAMAAGAIGLGSSTAEAHVGENGLPVASRLADKASSSRSRGRWASRGAASSRPRSAPRPRMEDLREIWRTSGRPVIWAAFFQRDDRPEYVPERLAVTEAFHRDGVEVLPQVSCRPLTMDFTMRNPYPFEGMPAWRSVMKRARVRAGSRVYGDAGLPRRAQGRPRREALRRLPRPLGSRPGAAHDAPRAQGARGPEPRRSRARHGQASGGRLARPRHRRRPRRGVPRGPAQHGREGRGRPHRPPAHADHAVGRGRAPVADVRRRATRARCSASGCAGSSACRSRPRSSASPTTRRAPIASRGAAGSRPATGPTSPSSIPPRWTPLPAEWVTRPARGRAALRLRARAASSGAWSTASRCSSAAASSSGRRARGRARSSARFDA